MKNGVLIYFLLIVLAISCRENFLEEQNSESSGTIFVESTPLGAEIYLGNLNTSKITPDSLTGLTPDIYPVTLIKQGYLDTTIAVNLKAGNKLLINIRLKQR